MTVSKRATRSTSDSVAGSDLARIDAHVVQPREYDELPELTDEMVARAIRGSEPTALRRGRPTLKAPRKLVSLRIEQATLDAFRSTGPGWQTRMNEVLDSAAKTLPKSDPDRFGEDPA